MGRNSTGVTSTGEAQRIEIGQLIKRGYFKSLGSHNRQLSWNDGSKISIEITHSATETYLRLFYTITDNQTGVKTKLDYKVLIDFVPSNLGKGRVLYFLCPVSKRRCRILYRAYGSHYFKAREAYKNRIYYEAQKNSKQYRLIDKFNTVRYKVESICESKKRNQTTFKGKPTKQSLKFESLIKKYERLDELSENFIMANIYKK